MDFFRKQFFCANKFQPICLRLIVFYKLVHYYSGYLLLLPGFYGLFVSISVVVNHLYILLSLTSCSAFSTQDCVKSMMFQSLSGPSSQTFYVRFSSCHFSDLLLHYNFTFDNRTFEIYFWKRKGRKMKTKILSSLSFTFLRHNIKLRLCQRT